jgi:hypothetical protein
MLVYGVFEWGTELRSHDSRAIGVPLAGDPFQLPFLVAANLQSGKGNSHNWDQVIKFMNLRLPINDAMKLLLFP